MEIMAVGVLSSSKDMRCPLAIITVRLCIWMVTISILWGI